MLRGLLRVVASPASKFTTGVQRNGIQQARCFSASADTTGASSATTEDGAETEGKPRRRKILQKQHRPIIQKLRAHNETHEAAAAAAGLEWRHMVATVLHRYPTITPDQEPWEIANYQMNEELTDFKRAWFLDQVAGTKADFIGDVNPSYEEIIGALPFTPAPRFSEADQKNDMRSTERRQAESAFLIVKRNREGNAWQFPQGKIMPEKDGDSARKGAERVIDRAVGNVNRYFISNAPTGHICYAYPPDVQKARGQYGAKVYYYRCQLIAGTIKLETRLYTDYAWVARDEVAKYTEDPLTAEFLTAMLPY